MKTMPPGLVLPERDLSASLDIAPTIKHMTPNPSMMTAPNNSMRFFLRLRLLVINLIRNHAQGQHLRAHDGLGTSLPISQDARQFNDLTQPAPIFFLFDFD